jgi:hypothetical protein
MAPRRDDAAEFGARNPPDLRWKRLCLGSDPGFDRAAIDAAIDHQVLQRMRD